MNQFFLVLVLTLCLIFQKVSAAVSSSLLHLKDSWENKNALSSQITFSQQQSTSSNFSSAEINYLYSFYNSTLGASWSYTQYTDQNGIPWNFTDIYSQNPCEQNIYWYGILSCGITTDGIIHITGLSLNTNNLVGTIAFGISNLAYLGYLELGANYLESNFPSDFGDLSFLYALSVDNNEMAGILPDNFGDLISLEQCYLSNNQFSGPIPATFTNLVVLNTLVVDNNYFTGQFPNLCNNGVQLSLFSLSASKNEFSGTLPVSLTNCVDLYGVVFTYNNMSGSIPSEFGELPALAFFQLNHNFINGTIPNSLTTMPSLLQLLLNNNELSGTIPTFCSNNGNPLVNLDVGFNHLNGTMPNSLGNCLSSNGFSVRHNKITGSIPNAVSGLPYATSFYFDDNMLTGTISSQFATNPYLTEFLVQDNLFNGTIPAFCSGTNSIINLDFAGNSFTGIIPNSIGNCASAEIINLSFNKLHGSIPETFLNLQSINFIILNNNKLTGSLPDLCSRYTTMFSINIESNLITGTIPLSLALCNTLDYITLSSNKLNGTIPNNFGELPLLAYLRMEDNRLTGSIPPQLGNCSNLDSIYLGTNQLTSSLPKEFSKLTKLTRISASRNGLTGSLPPEWSAMTSLLDMTLISNFISGEIPASYGNLTNLEFFNVDNNTLTGSIPNELFNITSIVQFTAEMNHLSGQISPLVNNWQQMTSFSVGNNDFTGSIPDEIFDNTNLLLFSMSTTFITGAVPRTIVNATSLLQFIATNNLLSGLLPYELSECRSLQALIVSNNILSGEINNIFSVNNAHLESVDLSFNALSGQLPSSLFNLPNLAELNLGSNCFHGSLPENMCACDSLSIIAMNGMSSATNCRVDIIENYDSYTTEHKIDGTFPNCLFSLPYLETLQITGTELSGTISADVTLLSRFNELTLSHNKLTGTIPNNIQSHQFNTLDLSFNKLIGSIINDICVNANSSSSLSLNVNRLSGSIPSCLQTAQNIDILDGNLFTCGMFDRSELPEHDGNYDQYACASNAFDLSIYLWLMIPVAILCILLGFKFIGDFSALTKSVYAMFYFSSLFKSQTTNDNAMDVYFMFKQSKYFCSGVVCVALVMTCILMPTYAVLSALYGSYSDTYAWQLSAGFISSQTGGIILFVLWFSLISVCVCALLMFNPFSQTATKPHNRDQNNAKVVKHQHWYEIGVLVLNIIVVVLVNVGFVEATLYSDNKALFWVEISISIFKLVWNGAVLPGLFNQSTSLLFQACITLFNSIIAPCVVIACIHPNCFLYVITTPPDISSTIGYIICISTIYSSGECILYGKAVKTSSYQPPFSYSYQCSSALLSSYAAVFIYTFLIDAFLKPLFFLCVVKLFAKWPNVWVVKTLYKVIPTMYKPASVLGLETIARKPVFKSTSIALNYINILIILFTFGVIFPPLAVVIAVDVLITAWLLQCNVELILAQAKDIGFYDLYLESINTQASNFIAIIRNMSFVVFITSAVFCSLFLMDIVGDQVGYKEALWAPLTLTIWTLCLYVVYFVVQYCWQPDTMAQPLLFPGSRKSEHDVENSTQSVVEISDIVKEGRA